MELVISYILNKVFSFNIIKFNKFNLNKIIF